MKSLLKLEGRCPCYAKERAEQIQFQFMIKKKMWLSCCIQRVADYHAFTLVRL